MKMILSSMLIMMTSIMYFMNHPLSMGMMILMQTMITCMISGMLVKTYWFSYILFLIFLGGLLVLFIYVSSIASNELFLFNLNMKMLNIIIMMIIIIMMMYFINIKYNNLIENNSEMNKLFTKMLFFNDENKINLNKMYNNQTSFLTMMLIIYLFVNLVAVVKITNIFYGPLRSSNK
ncbi:NADH dehydrogenase subunit 6 (mitochondrion) [Bombyx mori]|uniref:NADH-ubiquinone oxidoreductase chain 6 n=1 Tax=Bombyx mori TaxID=7091 RepID=Q9MIE4_BOMMO|nr:NADH dehydrogenase subunit 6 [Bombyx mori]AAF73761.1 NADH dehydrogenase 6 [Bombyx mori]AAK85728.1 NADH dehydrogenase 6 [Bombyx mori]ADE18232.1 NADH dehydrogenase subunit 6 [Bombyx mori]ADE18245.1 NADH dehydrogenase subunit 6 [Bombyx mori]ADE18258.1 NADH dehydrogenase subunit 6 [Bombyx mori]